MKESKLTHLVDPIREMLAQYEWVIKEFKKRNSVPIAGISCDFLPVEFFASSGVIPLKIPNSMRDKGCTTMDTEAVARVFDYRVVSHGCVFNHDSAKKRVLTFEIPDGSGEEHARKLHQSVNALLAAMQCAPIENIGYDALCFSADRYTVLRRTVRGILAQRITKPDLLSQEDLFLLMEAAVALPQSVIIEYFVELLRRLNETKSEYKANRIPALVHSCMLHDASVLDEIEDAGCIIVEDDTCNGRRQFDLSFTIHTEHLWQEILDAYSYKPLCPSLRPVEERHELFYSRLKSYGIELVLFLDDESCPARTSEIETLRKRLMRQGVDPLVLTAGTAKQLMGNYITHAGL